MIYLKLFSLNKDYTLAGTRDQEIEVFFEVGILCEEIKLIRQVRGKSCSL